MQKREYQSEAGVAGASHKTFLKGGSSSHNREEWRRGSGQDPSVPLVLGAGQERGHGIFERVSEEEPKYEVNQPIAPSFATQGSRGHKSIRDFPLILLSTAKYLIITKILTNKL